MAKTKRPESYTDVQTAIGERCRWVLEETNPNQTTLASELELDASTINKYIQGTRAQSIFFIRNFASRFRVSTDYLLFGVLTGVEERNLALRLAAKHPELVLGIEPPQTESDNVSLAAPARRRSKKVAEIA